MGKVARSGNEYTIQNSLIMTSCQYVYLIMTSRKTLAKYSDATVVLWLAGVQYRSVV